MIWIDWLKVWVVWVVGCEMRPVFLLTHTLTPFLLLWWQWYIDSYSPLSHFPCRRYAELQLLINQKDSLDLKLGQLRELDGIIKKQQDRIQNLESGKMEDVNKARAELEEVRQ